MQNLSSAAPGHAAATPVAGAGAQALVVADNRLPRVRHLLVEVPPRAAPGGLRAFVQALQRELPVTWWTGPAPKHCRVTLGFTHAGLLQLDVPARVRAVLRRLAPAFCEGAVARAARLGDHGASSARFWPEPFLPERLHLVLTLHERTAEALDAATAQVCRLARGNPIRFTRLDGAFVEPPRGASGQWVHFGLRDGLSQVRLRGVAPCAHEPAIARVPTPAPSAPSTPSAPVAPGELLLGHPRAHGDNPWLLADEGSKWLREFFRDGSFGVLRAMQQDVDGFEAFVARAVQRLRADWPADLRPPDDWSGYVKAKLAGRWPDGRPLRGPHWQNASGSDIYRPPEELDFSADEEGLGCPFGAHVRRLNPRGGGTSDDVVHARLRILARRGRPYGAPAWAIDEQAAAARRQRHERLARAGSRLADSPAPEGTTEGEPPLPPVPAADPDAALARGLMGQFFCASLEDQFEHLLGAWADQVPLGLPDAGDAKDPLIGMHENPAARFAIPLAGGRHLWLQGLTPFVKTRGMAYAFYPGREGLRLLLSEHDAIDRDEWEPLP